jgi:hypothetical protein
MNQIMENRKLDNCSIAAQTTCQVAAATKGRWYIRRLTGFLYKKEHPKEVPVFEEKGQVYMQQAPAIDIPKKTEQKADPILIPSRHQSRASPKLAVYGKTPNAKTL